MHTRFACCLLFVLALSPSALADTLAQAVRTDALRIRPLVDQAQASAASRPALAPPALDTKLAGALELWGLNASRLAADINARRGPDDLACIFRGMAEETGVQLQAASTADTGAVRAAALRKLSLMLRDAAEVAPAAEDAGRMKNAAGTGVPAALHSCQADPKVRF